MTKGLITGVIFLPGMALVFIPAAILFFSKGTRFSADLQYPNDVTFYLAIIIGAAGVYLAIKTATLFLRFGDGTPAPWEPPKKLVILGPYQYVRNPMITGAFLILLGETILFNCWPLLLWSLVFLSGNLIYLPLVEEKELQKRHGDDYLEYVSQVPRWIPRFQKWDR